MKRKFLRWGVLLLLPLALGTSLGGVKWKQLHPTPTQLDLQERNFLRKAKFLDVYVGGQKIKLSPNEFKTTLDDFYLIDLGDKWPSAMRRPNRSVGPNVLIRACDERDNEWSPFAEIRLNSGISYAAGHRERPNAPERRVGLIMASVHPVTLRRLNELIAKHLPAH